MELWWIPEDGSVQGAYWYQGLGWHFYELAPAGSASPQSAIAAVSRIPTSMEIWWVGADLSVGDAYWYEDPVPASDLGLGSGWNYVMYSDCSDLLSVTVTIVVTETITGDQGVGFQLNASSRSGAVVAAQQYCLSLAPGATDLRWIIENFLAAGENVPSLPQDGHVATLPQSAIPVGYRLTITLVTDIAANVAGATFAAYDENGVLLGQGLVDLVQTGVAPRNVAPIVAFQLDIVGWANRAATNLSSGSGRIEYACSAPLSVLNFPPDCACAWWTTNETSNVAYGVLPEGPSSYISQTFDNSGPMVQQESGGGLKQGPGQGMLYGLETFAGPGASVLCRSPDS